LANFSEPESSLKECLPANTYQTRVPQVECDRRVRPAGPRYRNEISKYILRRSDACIRCGKCATVCLLNVHSRKPGYKYFAAGRVHACIGASCEKTDHYCVRLCPKNALEITENPMMQLLGDYRWSADMILATWKMAETGEVPAEEYGYDYETGHSGGGFDRLRFKFPEKPPVKIDADEIETGIDLNRRDDGRPKIHIDVPWYGGGMSYGSVSNTTQLAKARAAVAWNTFTCTGEGGYMERMRPYDDHVITQVATGLFGVREETIQRVPIVEFKYAQGAKPGLGGHLLGDKNTISVSKMREAVKGISLFSPFPFHSVYSIEDHMKHIDWIKHINRRALISTKVSTPTDVDMVAVGSFYAGTHIVHIDGGYGGTGAAPDIAKKNIAMPIEYAIPKVHGFLEAEGARDVITLIASGGIRNPYDVAKAIALGADGAVIGTSELIALGCVRCTRCESGRGCPRSIATTDSELAPKIDLEWATQRIVNMYNAWRNEIIRILQRFGMRNISELRGRSDLLMHMDYTASGQENPS
jgi:glutamate synthase domain-containing protein 2